MSPGFYSCPRCRALVGAGDDCLYCAMKAAESKRRSRFPWVIFVLLAAAVLALIFVPFAGAQEAQPVPAAAPAPCDPGKVPCLTTESLALALRAWSPGATEPRDLGGGALQAELRYRRLRLQGQAIGTATSGSYKSGDWSTVRDVEAHLAVGYDALRLPGGVAIGPMAAIGGAAVLPEGGARASIARSYTLMLGAEGSWPGGRIHLGIGSAHPLDRGLSVAAKWKVPLKGRVYSMGYVAIGRRNVPASPEVPAHSESAVSAWTAVGVRL